MHSDSTTRSTVTGRLPAAGVFHRSRRQILRTFAYSMMWLLPIMAFTTPVQESVSYWEPLDLAKLAILAFACFGGAFAIKLHLDHPNFRRVLDPLIPLFMFFGFTLISLAWSPLRGVTLAQSGALVATLLYAAAIALLCTHRGEISSILKNLNWILMVFSAIVFGFFLWNPEASGLDRSRIHSGGDGIVHPTASGATASLGLVLPILCHVVGKFSWARRLILPSLFIHGAVLFFSNSRLATGLAMLTIGGLLFWHASIRQRAVVVSLAGILGLLAIVLDPGFTILDSAGGAGAEYVSRGQSADQLKGFSGRTEMWAAIWNEYSSAMVLGHGYFVTSERGELLVWNEWKNHTAHNLVLQVAVSTGILGLVLFLYGLIQPVLFCLPLSKDDLFRRRLFGILFVIGVWFVLWAQLGISFMGPIRPESVVFFTLLGVGIGQSSQLPREI